MKSGPSRSSRQPAHPDADQRRRALEGHPSPESGPDGGPETDPAAFRRLLETIPDLEEADRAVDTSSSGVGHAPGNPDGAAERGDAPRRPTAWWRTASFAVTLALLVAAIPLLGREGYRLVVRSTAGREVVRTDDPKAPNYEQMLDSTPTMVIVQSGVYGSLRGLTFVSLNSEKGGTVMFVPLMTALQRPAYGLGALGMVYDAYLPKVDHSQEAVGHALAEVVDVGIDEIVPLDDRSIAQLVGPAAPLRIDNPDPVPMPDGSTIPVGNVTLKAGQVGPYMGFIGEGEDQTSQFVRQERVWRAWLNAVAASTDPGVVPGLRDQGIGRFVRTLAAGSVRYLTLPGTFNDAGLYVPDAAALKDAMLDAVPVPDPPSPGARVVVRLLNGVAPGTPPPAIVRKVVAAGGSVSILGNGPSFGRAETEVVYADAAHEAAAKEMLGALGATGGTVRLDPSAPDTVDLTIVLGRDVLGAGGGGG